MGRLPPVLISRSTAALVAGAVRSGVETIFLSAAGEDVARLYERLGFERVGQAGLAEPRSPSDAGGSA